MRFIAYILLVALFVSCNKEDKRYLVVSKIQSVNKLATCEAVVDKVILGTKEKRLLGLITINEARFLAYSEAIVKTGIEYYRNEDKVNGYRDVEEPGL